MFTVHAVHVTVYCNMNSILYGPEYNNTLAHRYGEEASHIAEVVNLKSGVFCVTFSFSDVFFCYYL